MKKHKKDKASERKMGRPVKKPEERRVLKAVTLSPEVISFIEVVSFASGKNFSRALEKIVLDFKKHLHDKKT